VVVFHQRVELGAGVGGPVMVAEECSDGTGKEYEVGEREGVSCHGCKR